MRLCNHTTVLDPDDAYVPGSCRCCYLHWQDSLPALTPGARVVRVYQRAYGIGDSLLGLTAVGGLKEARPYDYVVYAVADHTRPFVKLFDGGYDRLTEYTAAYEAEALRMNDGYDAEYGQGCPTPRWLRYARNIGAPRTVLPRVRRPDKLRALAADFAGCVAIAPYSSSTARNYPAEAWASVARLLHKAGHRVVVLDDRHDRCNMFDCEKVFGQPADLVSGVVLSSSCVLGNDSGMAHLAGCLGTPAVVLSGVLLGRNVYGVYPSVRVLQGRKFSTASISPPEVSAAVGLVLSTKKMDRVDGTVPFRRVTNATLEEQRRYLEEEGLYRAGEPRRLCSLLGALHEELAGQSDLQNLVLEAVYMARMTGKHCADEDVAWNDEYALP
jgi:hypothetical protein